MNDYPCPECGYDGPHALVTTEGGVLVVECGNSACAVEFSVPVGTS